MKIQYASDLHLEFPENKGYLKENPLRPIADILVLAGDIVPFAIMDKHKDFFNYLSDHFETTYWVPGNHEYYYYDLSMKGSSFIEEIKSNVFLINNMTAMHEDTKLIFSTLWSMIKPENQWIVQQRLSDFHVIKYKKKPFLPSHYNSLHQESINFLETELKQNAAEKTIVVTHHVPTFLNYPEKYKGDALNDAFAVELVDLIETFGPDFWIFGHHHYNGPDFKIGKTQFVTNQLGYVRAGEHKLFDSSKEINLMG